jgi:trigger factor
MQSNFEKTSSTLGKIKVDIVEADYKAAFDKKIKEYSKTAQVKGFRPGHVPVQYIKNIYGKSVLIDEVIKVASGEVTKIINENKLNVVGEPVPTNDSYNIDWGKQQDYSFEYEVGYASDFTVDLEKLPVITQYNIDANAEAVQKTIEDLLTKYPKESEPENSETGDLVFGELRQEATEFFFQSGIPTDKVKADSQFIFKGLEKDSTVSFDIQSIFESTKELGFATGKSDEEAEALNGTFEFKVTRILRTEKNELNQEFFDKTVGKDKVSNQAEFEAEIKKIINENYSRETEYLLNFDIENTLLETFNMELPEAFLKDFLIEINKDKVSAEQVEKELPQIAKGVKLDFIKADIAKQLDVKVEMSDVKAVIKEEIMGYFGGYNYEGMESFIDDMAEKQLKAKKQEELRKYIDKSFGTKVIAAVREKIKTEIKVVNPNEFQEIAKNSFEA